MDTSPNASTRSHIPRPSRIPRAGSSIRPSPSGDSLRASTTSLSIPKLRAAPSRDQLSSRGISSTASAKQPLAKPHIQRQGNDNVFKKPLARPVSREQDEPVQDPERGVSRELDNVQRESEHHSPSRKPRPSLSERTIETLSNLPPLPALHKKPSNFFNPESPLRPPSRSTNGSRPGSSYQQDNMMQPPSRNTPSRPDSSHLNQAIPIDFRASTNNFRPSQSSLSNTTPIRPSTAKSLKTPKSISNLRQSGNSSHKETTGLPQERSPSPVKEPAIMTPIKSASRGLTGRTVRPMASASRLSKKPSTLNMEDQKVSPTISNTSSDGTFIAPINSNGSIARAESSSQTITPRKSSLALRDHIAKAKAAKKAQAAKQTPGGLLSEQTDQIPIIPSESFDFGLGEDPFNQLPNIDSAKGLLRKRIDAARTDGRLNIAAMGLKSIPAEVMDMYNLEALNTQAGSWAESVDLIRFVAADNDLESLGEEIFPDIDLREMMDDEDSKGNQFAGLETLDLHGNILRELPIGLRRLQVLTVLNLSNNKLGNECFEVISQIPGLRDLKLANNELSGQLNEGIAKLHNLEVLEVQKNSLTSLPDGLVELIHLRILNLTDNSFTSLPFDKLQHLPITELSVAKNKLTGVLVKTENLELPRLQIFDLAFNSLTSLATAQVSFPALHQLICSANRLTNLPDMTSWTSLLTLSAEDNSISTIPEGFALSTKLKNVDLSGNNIKVLDDRIGRMESLDIFRISGNPLREKKFSAMRTEDLKKALKARLPTEEPHELDEEGSDGEFFEAPTSPSRSTSSEWLIKLGGVLDKSNTKSASLNPVIIAQIASGNVIRVVELHHNKFQEIPSAIAFFSVTLTTLNMSHNEMMSDTFLKEDLDLPFLKELNLSSNTFNSLRPLLNHLNAPRLEKIDVSFNRLSSLPVLKSSFPCLTAVFASNNTIKELSPECVQGLKILDCSSNDLTSLNARIGLLGGPGGLERLDVSGNRFRVPKYTVLDKGTEATLAWLRDRIPVETTIADVD